jgi:hypothetical protein
MTLSKRVEIPISQRAAHRGCQNSRPQNRSEKASMSSEKAQPLKKLTRVGRALPRISEMTHYIEYQRKDSTPIYFLMAGMLAIRLFERSTSLRAFLKILPGQKARLKLTR